MAETIYQETREGQSPEVTSAGNNMVVNWKRQPSGLQQSSQILSTIMATLEAEEEKKQKKLKDRADTYKTLREAGYEPKAAYDALASGKLPTTPPGETTAEKKDKAGLAKTEADTEASKAKAEYYRNGGKRTVIDKMTPNQLQSRLKFLSEKPYSQRTAADESEMASIDAKLRDLSTSSSEPEADAPPKQAAPKVGGKIRVRRLSDGQMGSISPQNFDPQKYERA